ncbi:GNAT family N-acetyltransferase [uncultured Duncaniella sp.]|uniref:GNAT family N-acetyltransferase n=1 Tax=uncultured Duncaniella sp. TaxID=2768039 RepID=UPI0025EAB88F|nr:GNAT family N-acetyltransferase [uncultured Duncaniella sp.]
MQIETPRLILRPWREEDAETLYKYAGDPRVGTPAGWPPHKSVEESREIIRTVFSAPEVYAVVLKETQEPVGCCGIIPGGVHSSRIQADEGELGYWIAVPYWGQGLIPEAVNALINHGFKDLGLRALWIGHYDDNAKSHRVAEKCGFTYSHTESDSESGKKEHFMILRNNEER